MSRQHQHSPETDPERQIQVMLKAHEISKLVLILQRETDTTVSVSRREFLNQMLYRLRTAEDEQRRRIARVIRTL